MAISDAFLNPLGLLGLLTLVPLIILYIIKPDPRRLEIPTLQFLPNVTDEGGTNPIIERLRRNILLLLQILALIFIALAIAQPAIQVSKSAATGETVIVLDASGSMATETGAGSRFDAAVSRATSEVTATTSVVVAGSSTRIAVNQGGADEALTALDTVSVSDTESDLRSAISQGMSLASEEARIVVLSDFADDSDWRSIVETARARGNPVELMQFGEGGDDNVGIVDMSFAGSTVTVSVKNFGESEVDRTVSMAGDSTDITLEAGDVTTVKLDVPPGGARVSLSPGDSFPTDDTAAIAAPSETAIDVALVTNERNRFLHAALTEMSRVDVEVKNPPVGTWGDYDVVIFSDVAQERLLQSTVNNAESVLADGGGVAIQAQSDIEDLTGTYGEMLLISPQGVEPGSTADVVSEHRIVRDIDFAPPEQYIRASLDTGIPLVNATDGSPLLAIGREGSGRLMYYGFMTEASDVHTNYLYPIFWKRSVYHLAGRERLASMNLGTGTTYNFPETETVDTPSGTSELTTLTLADAGYYSAGRTEVAANLLSVSESGVAVDEINATGSGSTGGGDSSTMVPRRLTPLLALLALAFVGTEVALMKYRGDV